jgi:uncharacterized membrane protein YkvA (DUF1232 family)
MTDIIGGHGKFKILVLIALILYVISPVDAVPGPIDDIILCIVYVMANRKCIDG